MMQEEGEEDDEDTNWKINCWINFCVCWFSLVLFSNSSFYINVTYRTSVFIFESIVFHEEKH